MKQALGFIALALVAGVLIGTTRLWTTERIKRNQLEQQAAIIAELLGGTADPGASARLCRTEVRGYAGAIELLVLPDSRATAHRTLQSVRVLNHRETPGIGDFIELEKSNWILDFQGLQTRAQPSATIAQWRATLDAVTGATITRNAIIDGVASACPYSAPRGADPLFGAPIDTPADGR